MQVTETKNEGLSREFSITIPAGDIDARIGERLEEVGKTVKMPGFRPGKVPMSILRQRFGKSVLGEVVEKAVTESTDRLMKDKELRPAMQPKVEITSFDEGKDLVFSVGVDCMPDIDTMDFKKLELTRLKAKVSDKEVDEAVERIAKDFRSSEPVAKARKTKVGDVAVIDFVGKLDGTPFDGGAGEDYHLELGSGRFIPGFEDQLVGKNVGDKVEVKVTFPAEYGSQELAGKDAVFDVEIKEIREYVDQKLDDEFAKSLGLDGIDTLRNQIRERIEADYGRVARNYLKRDLLDALHEGHDFEVPAAMVDAEFDQIWQQIEHAKEHGHLDEEDAAKSDDELKEEYRDIALRRVRLGLLLAHVGEENKIEVTQEELNRAIMAEAQRYQGQERQVLEYIQRTPEALASIRAPLVEDKVVDYIIEMAKVKDKEVAADDLVSEGEASAKPAKGKKASAKKASAKKAASKKAEAKKS